MDSNVSKSKAMLLSQMEEAHALIMAKLREPSFSPFSTSCYDPDGAARLMRVFVSQLRMLKSMDSEMMKKK